MSTADARVSVVVATRDREARLAGLLAALDAQALVSDAFEVVVVDDGSRDGTSGLLDRVAESSGLRLTVVSGSGDGPAVARNAGWRAARGALIAFTDDDCEPPPEWLGTLLAAARANPGSIVQGPTFPIPDELDRTGPFSRTKLIDTPNPWYQTCNILYPRNLLERLNGFDERFPEALGEDTDLGWRGRELGVQLVWCEAAFMHHAVDDLGARGFLRSALRGADAVAVFRRHPQLRRQTLRHGVIRNPAIPRLGLAATGLALVRKQPAAALFAIPYLHHLAGRCRAQHAGLRFAPYYAAYDMLAAYTSLRGSLRHRTLVL